MSRRQNINKTVHNDRLGKVQDGRVREGGAWTRKVCSCLSKCSVAWTRRQRPGSQHCMGEMKAGSVGMRAHHQCPIGRHPWHSEIWVPSDGKWGHYFRRTDGCQAGLKRQGPSVSLITWGLWWKCPGRREDLLPSGYSQIDPDPALLWGWCGLWTAISLCCPTLVTVHLENPEEESQPSLENPGSNLCAVNPTVGYPPTLVLAYPIFIMILKYSLQPYGAHSYRSKPGHRSRVAVPSAPYTGFPRFQPPSAICSVCQAQQYNKWVHTTPPHQGLVV